MTARVIVLDLDDTLYDEMSFVRSGFRAVAAWGEDRLGVDRGDTFDRLMALLTEQGRGRIFDEWLDGRAPVREALAVYRQHSPNIHLWPEADRLLQDLEGLPVYVVTDGHKGVQWRKAGALGLPSRVRRVVLTNRHGRHRAKPSPYCFELIARTERVSMHRLVHVGDNPAKDFVGLNPLGVTTVRVLTGQHAAVVAAPGAEAQHRIPSLAGLLPLLEGLPPVEH